MSDQNPVSFRPDPSGSLSDAFTIVPNDDANLPQATRMLYINGTAAVTLRVTLLGGSTITLVNLAASQYHPWMVKKVFATGTTIPTNTQVVGGY